MMPVVRQRAAIFIGLVMAGACYALIARSAIAQGTVGLTLLGTGGTQTLLLLVGLSLPVIAIALAAAAMGNPLVGPLIVCGGLIVAASMGGSIDGWIRNIESPADYWLLFIETFIWAALVVIARLAVRAGWPKLRSKLPAPMRSAYCRELVEPAEHPTQQAGIAAGCVLVSAAVVALFMRWALIDYITILIIALVLVSLAWVAGVMLGNAFDRSAPATPVRAAIGPAFLAGIVTTTVGTFVLMLLQQSADAGQVIGAMLVGFTAAALLAHQVYPTTARLPMLLSPLCIAAAGYAWMALSNDSASQVMLRYFLDFSQDKPPITTLPPVTLALPIFYASAGVAGVCIGIGWSQALHVNADRHVVIAT